jgi:hypothetical protein
MNSAFVISVICLLFCCFIYFYFRWYIKRRTSASELLGEYRDEVYRLTAVIDSATDRDSRLVEERIKRLRAVLEDTDKRISVYLRELDRSRSGEALYTTLGRGIRSALTAPESQQPPPAEKPAKTAVPSTQPSLFQSPEPAPEKSNQQIRSQIETLARQGIPPAEIASRLGISLSEVDLAMNLLGLHTD